VVWRTKVGPSRPVEHATRDEAEAHIAQLRARYRAGAASLRLVRLYDPDGGVTLVDFGTELRDQSRALRDLERATAARDRAIREATSRWEDSVRRVAALGFDTREVAEAAGVTVREVNRILRGRPPG
jgi:CRP-like cAMP-binding protein